MNKIDAELLERTTEQLVAQGLAVVAEKEPRLADTLRADAWLRVGKDKHHAQYVVEVKRRVTPATLGAVVAQLREAGKTTKRIPLLFAGYITPPVADRLRAAGQQFADVAGNAYLEGPGLLIFVTGRKPEQEILAEKPGLAFTPAGLKTLFALLCNPELAEAPYRQIADAADVALGALPAVLRALRNNGYLVAFGQKRKLIATKRLLDDWALAYARTLRPKQLARTLVVRTFDGWQEWDLKADGAQWGGEPAAHLLTKHLMPGVLTIYAHKLPARLMVTQHLVGAKASNDGGLVEIRTLFWGKPLQYHTYPEVVAPPLVYADLLATGDGRCIETARLIYEKYLARPFPTK
jgi:hypothetical protein